MADTQKKACLSCRQRKLKCDKQQPCANCVTRSVDCKEQVLAPATRGIKRTHDDSDPIPNILIRLEYVEAYINAQKIQSQHSSLGSAKQVVQNAPQNSAPTPGASTRAPSTGAPTPATTVHTSSTAKNTARNIQAVTSEFGVPLGPLTLNDNILSHALTHHLSISISTDSYLTPQGPVDPHQIQLPPIHESIRLLDVYFDYIGYFQHIIYQPHALTLIDEVYHQISQVSSTTAPRGLALILAVIALGVILEPIAGNLDTVLPVLKERLRISAVYLRASMDCLEQHRRRMSHSIESVQAMLVLQFLLNHVETHSPRCRSLLAEAVTVSHSLGLHLIDSSSSRGGLPQEGVDPIIKEMKRRVWWYLTATDWMVSMVEGPFDAVYLVQPNRIASNVPRHINDDDLGNPYVSERPLSEPTSMSYNLHRLKIAEVSRCISDQMPRDVNDATCELILSLDSKLESLILNLPAFFRIEIADSEETARIDRLHPHIQMQRLTINFMVNLIRCKLHFPFLPGHPSESLHAFSRDASLRAARRVLSVHREMSVSNVSHSSDFMKIQGIVFHMFTGALILATDLCCNQPQGEDRERQSTELLGVLRQLEGIKQHSQSAARFLEILTRLLVKYGVWAPETTISVATDDQPPAVVGSFGQDYMPAQDVESLAPFPFEELWDTFVERPSALDLYLFDI